MRLAPWPVKIRGPRGAMCATARQPSHFGSSTLPSPSGSDLAGVASIGAIGPSNSTAAPYAACRLYVLASAV